MGGWVGELSFKTNWNDSSHSNNGLHLLILASLHLNPLKLGSAGIGLIYLWKSKVFFPKIILCTLWSFLHTLFIPLLLWLHSSMFLFGLFLFLSLSFFFLPSFLSLSYLPFFLLPFFSELDLALDMILSCWNRRVESLTTGEFREGKHGFFQSLWMTVWWLYQYNFKTKERRVEPSCLTSYLVSCKANKKEHISVILEVN